MIICRFDSENFGWVQCSGYRQQSLVWPLRYRPWRAANAQIQSWFHVSRGQAVRARRNGGWRCRQTRWFPPIRSSQPLVYSVLVLCCRGDANLTILYLFRTLAWYCVGWEDLLSSIQLDFFWSPMAGPIGSMHIFDPLSSSWSMANISNINAAPSPRFDHGFAFCRGKLYLHGGRSFFGECWPVTNILISLAPFNSHPSVVLDSDLHIPGCVLYFSPSEFGSLIPLQSTSNVSGV